LSNSSSIKFDIICQFRLFGGKIAIIATLRSFNLYTQHLSRELQNLVLYLAVLLQIINIFSPNPSL